MTGDASANARHPSHASRLLNDDITAVDRARGDEVYAAARVGSDKLYPTRTDRECRALVPVVTFCVSRGRTGGVGGGTPDVGGVAIRGQGGLRGERDTGGLRLGEKSKVERSARVSKRVPIARRESARLAVALRRVCFSRDNDVGRRPHACARRLSGEFDARVRREMPL